MLIIADSSELISLATCDALDVLLEVYDDVKVPEAVYMETVAPEKFQSDLLGEFLAGRVGQVDTSRSVIRQADWGAGKSKP